MSPRQPVAQAALTCGDLSNLPARAVDFTSCISPSRTLAKLVWLRTQCALGIAHGEVASVHLDSPRGAFPGSSLAGALWYGAECDDEVGRWLNARHAGDSLRPAVELGGDGRAASGAVSVVGNPGAAVVGVLLQHGFAFSELPSAFARLLFNESSSGGLGQQRGNARHGDDAHSANPSRPKIAA